MTIRDITFLPAKIKCRIDLEGFPNLQLQRELPAIIRRFVTVQLHNIQLVLFYISRYARNIFIHKYPYLSYVPCLLQKTVPQGIRLQATLRTGIKDQPYIIDTGCQYLAYIRLFCKAAYFYFHISTVV